MQDNALKVSAARGPTNALNNPPTHTIILFSGLRDSWESMGDPISARRHDPLSVIVVYLCYNVCNPT